MDQITEALLAEVGLIYVSDSDDGIRRERRGRGFSYRLPDGLPLQDRLDRQRIEALAIPPAYRKVWICMQPEGHIQATGLDARGRKQYRYHPDWHSFRSQKKYGQLIAFGAALPRLRRRAQADAEKLSDPRVAALGAMTLLLDAAHLRVGNHSYFRENGTFGATTLLKRHVRFGDHLEIKFIGKGGRLVRRKLNSPRLQRVLERVADLPGKQLFAWSGEDGVMHGIDSGQFNRYLADISGFGFSAKTFRTWGGTLAAFEVALAAVETDEAPTIGAMCEAAAAELVNTKTVCRDSYIHPAVLALAAAEEERRLLKRQLGRRAKKISGLRVGEVRLLAFLKANARAASRRDADADDRQDDEDREDRQRNEEQDLGNAGRRGGNAGKAEKAGHK